MFVSMDCWEKTYGIKQADEGTFNDDFHIFGLYWDEYVMVRAKRSAYHRKRQTRGLVRNSKTGRLSFVSQVSKATCHVQ